VSASSPRRGAIRRTPNASGHTSGSRLRASARGRRPPASGECPSWARRPGRLAQGMHEVAP
jgi:hypothetical protein